MSSQKLVIFLIIASLLGLSFIFINRILNGSCNIEDKKVCSFLQSNKKIDTTNMKGQFISKQNQAQNSELDVNWEKGQNNSHISINKQKDEILQAILSDKYVYIKDYSDGKWWREQKDVVSNSISELPFNPELYFTKLMEQLNKEDNTYTFVEETSCGQDSCYRYQVTNPTQAEKDQLFIFFDTRDYKLKSVFQVSDISTGELHVTYEDIQISEPTDYKIVSSGRNIFMEYLDLKEKEKPKNFEYLKQFQQQRIQSEGTSTIPYKELESSSEAVIQP